MIILQSPRLKVTIDEPGEGRNNTVRFDRAGYITSVVLDGEHEFLTVEPNNLPHPCSGGAGLCSEITAEGVWDETPVGGKSPKFGVGLLTKPGEERYEFYGPYETEHFDISIESDGATAVFETAPKPCMGYALRQKKTVSVAENEIIMTFEYENVGEKALRLSEYVHNFVTIDRLPTGPDYFLRFPTCASRDGMKPTRGNAPIIGRGDGYTYTGYCERPGKAPRISGEEIDPSKPFTWKLTNAATTASISEEDSFIPSNVDVWTIDHIISAECFNKFELTPGETKLYTRKWTFED